MLSTQSTHWVCRQFEAHTIAVQLYVDEHECVRRCQLRRGHPSLDPADAAGVIHRCATSPLLDLTFLMVFQPWACRALAGVIRQRCAMSSLLDLASLMISKPLRLYVSSNHPISLWPYGFRGPQTLQGLPGTTNIVHQASLDNPPKKK